MNTESNRRIELECGKFYRSRNGDKWRVIYLSLLNSRMDQPFLALRESDEAARWFNCDGQMAAPDKNGFDLVSEWVDEPVVNWSLFSPWVVAVAMDPAGTWYEYTGQIREAQGQWIPSYTPEMTQTFRVIPKDYAPQYSGPWQQSKVLRPKKGEA